MAMLRLFISEEKGNIAIIAALLLLPLMMLGGVGIDYSRISSERSKITASIDSALADPSLYFGSKKQAELAIKNLVDANTGRSTANVDISIRQDNVVIEAQDTIDTPLLAFFGQPQTNITISHEFGVQETVSTINRHVQAQYEEAEQKVRALMTNRMGNPNKLTARDVIRARRELDAMRRQLSSQTR